MNTKEANQILQIRLVDLPAGEFSIIFGTDKTFGSLTAFHCPSTAPSLPVTAFRSLLLCSHRRLLAFDHCLPLPFHRPFHALDCLSQPFTVPSPSVVSLRQAARPSRPGHPAGEFCFSLPSTVPGPRGVAGCNSTLHCTDAPQLGASPRPGWSNRLQ